MKKIMTKILVLALLLIQLVPTIVVNAANGTNSNDGVITIDNAIPGKTYSVYQILKLESYDTEDKAYRYVTTSDKWAEFINSAAVKDVYVTIDEFGYVTWKENASVETFSKLALAYAKENKIEATDSKTLDEDAESTTLKFENLNLGYYLVDSSLGALCGLNTTKPSVIIKEKNSEPSVDKKVEENGTFGEKNDAKIGDIVNFQTTITVGAGAENYVLYDILSSGLTLLDNTDHPITVKIGDTVVDAKNYTKTVDVEAGTFTIAFNNDYLATITKDTKIVVTYSAILNEKAVIEGKGNPNETYLKYGDDHETTHDTTITYTYSFKLKKVNSSNEVLEGAEFRLYLDSACTKEVKLVYDSQAGVYRVTTDTTITGEVIKVGTATIVGLDHATYYLKETKQPEGYNILTTPVDVKVNSTEAEITVTNLTGAELPDTGSIGTMIFVIVGTIMILGFGVLLVTKLRMSKMNIQA